jgi:hypothetical protein
MGSFGCDQGGGQALVRMGNIRTEEIRVGVLELETGSEAEVPQVPHFRARGRSSRPKVGVHRMDAVVRALGQHAVAEMSDRLLGAQECDALFMEYSFTFPAQRAMC